MADNATPGETFQPPMAEFDPSGGGNPAGPVDGAPPPSQDTDFIMDTFFGDDSPKSEPNPSGGQGKEPTPSSAKAGSSSASPQPAPAATEGVESPPAPPAPGSTPTPQPAQAEPPAGATPTQTPGPGQQPAPVATPPAEPELTPEQRLQLAGAAALRQQNEQLLARLNALEGKSQQPGQPGQQPQQPQQPGSDEHVNLVVPDQLAGAIFGEDPVQAKQAMNLLISGVATNAVKIAVERAERLIEARLAPIQEREAQTEQQQQEQAYFKQFPVHNNDLYRPVIQATVSELYKELPHLQWDDTTIAAVGARVNNKLLALGINPATVAVPPTAQTNGQPQPQAPAQPKAQPKPAPMLDTAVRAAEPAEAGDFIRNTFS